MQALAILLNTPPLELSLYNPHRASLHDGGELSNTSAGQDSQRQRGGLSCLFKKSSSCIYLFRFSVSLLVLESHLVISLIKISWICPPLSFCFGYIVFHFVVVGVVWKYCNCNGSLQTLQLQELRPSPTAEGNWLKLSAGMKMWLHLFTRGNYHVAHCILNGERRAEKWIKRFTITIWKWSWRMFS